MIKVHIEIPSNRHEDMDDLITQSKIPDPAGFIFKFFIGFNNHKTPAKELSSRVIKIWNLDNKIIEPCVSMTELRKLVSEKSQRGKPDFCIVCDSGLVFKDGWKDWVAETIDLMPSQKAICSLAGYFGSNYRQDTIHIPKTVQFGMNIAILHTADLGEAWQQMPVLAGGAEDPLIVAWCIVKCGALPLKRFQAPIRHVKWSKEEYELSPIHASSISTTRNDKVLQKVWGDENWLVANTYSQSGTKRADGKYYSTGPKSARRMYQEIIKQPRAEGYV